MIQHYLTIIYRNILRSKGYFLINLVGLTAGMSCTMLIYLWVTDELHMNKFNVADDRLYEVMENQTYADNVMTTTSTPGILAENMKHDFPDVEYAETNAWTNTYTLTVGEKNIKADGLHVGEDHFNIFSIPLIQGNADQVLKDKLSMVVSRDLAKRLFGSDDNVIGKTVELQHKTSFHITGVFDALPLNSELRYDFLLSFEQFKDENKWVLEWGNNGPSTFILLRPGVNVPAFEKKIKEYVKGKNKDSNVALLVQKFSDRYLYGTYKNGKQSGGRIEYVELLSIIAVFILVIACINFMNLSTARATRKSKEVGIKKSVGAGRGSLIFQYLSESMITALLGMILSLILVAALLPIFNSITDKHIVISWTSWPFVLSFFLITVFTGMVAGSYPAIYLSGFRPAAVLKGEVKGSLAELWARKGLVVFQFFLSVILIVSVLVIYQQIGYVQSANLGYAKDHLIKFGIEGKVEESLATFLEQLRRMPGVKSASSMGHSLTGQNSNTSGLEWEGKNPNDRILFENMAIHHDAMKTLGFTLLEGHDFTELNEADTNKIIFNEAAVRVMGLKDPVGKHIRLWDTHDMEIIAVVKDFHFQSLHQQVKPLFIRFSPSGTWNVIVRLEAGKEKETLASITKFYSDFNPGFTLDYAFQDDDYAKLYAAEQRVASLSGYFATMAIVISCLGLFGLAAFTAERRQKEIGIRKALGSSSTSIVLLLSADFTKMVLLAVILGLPLAYYLLDKWLQQYAYHIPLEIWYFAVAGLIALVIAWITVTSQSIRASRINPVQCLRAE